MTTAEGDITTLNGRMTTAEGEIDTLQTDLTATTGRVSTVETELSSSGTRISTLETEVNNLATSGGDVSAADLSVSGAIGPTATDTTQIDGLLKVFHLPLVI